MLTLLGALLGFFSSSFPEVLKFFNQKRDRAHELAIMDKQIELSKSGQSSRLEEVRLQAESAEQVALYHHAKRSNIKQASLGQTSLWVDALAASVRPVITYAFFGLYGVIKVSQWIILTKTLPSAQSFVFLWSGEDEALFAAVMSFWFGHRALIKRR